MNTYPHFRDRLLERYGLDITEEEYFELCNQEHSIVNRKYGQYRVIVRFKGETVYALLGGSNMKPRLTTALPIEKLHNHLNQHLFKNDNQQQHKV